MTVNILGIPGSLRAGSFNRAAMREAQRLCPPTGSLKIFELHDIPLFNQDFELNPPESVKQFKQEIRRADAVLLSTPEYNYSTSGVLKNAIDWASRPYGDNAWEGKPIAIMGASISMTGTVRAQYHLRQMFVFLNMHAVNQPEVMIPNAKEKFDDNGNLKDEFSKQRMRELLEALIAWTQRLKRPEASPALKRRA